MDSAKYIEMYAGKNEVTKNRFRKILFCLTAFIFIIGNCMTTFSAKNGSLEENVATIYHNEESAAKFYAVHAGKKVSAQTPRGALAQQNMVPSKTLAGTIYYRAAVDTGYVDYGLRCYYDARTIGSATYTINGNVGNAIALLSMIASVFVFLIPAMGPYAAAFICALGIAITGSMISTACTETARCIETDYTWTLVDTADAYHNKKVTGAAYHIEDTKSANTGKTYLEGYTTDNWETQALAVLFHDEMFGDTTWEVVSWS